MPKREPIDLSFLADHFPGIDGKQVVRHGQLVELWHQCSVQELVSDLNVLTQILAFKAHQAQVLAVAQEALWKGGTHDCGEWELDGKCQLCGVSL